MPRSSGSQSWERQAEPRLETGRSRVKKAGLLDVRRVRASEPKERP